MTVPRSRSGPARLRLARVVALAALIALLPLGGSASAQEPTIRLTGDTNVAAAIAWSQATYLDGTASAALLARDDDFADALASGAAQGALDAPLLLTNSGVLSPETLAELNRLDPEIIYVLGGDDAVSPVVVTELEAAGFTTDRVAGANRLSTAVEIAQRWYPSATSVVLARAFGDEEDPTRAFADSVAVNAFTNGSGIPVLLTDTETLSTETATYIAASTIQEVIVAGGQFAVSDPTIAQVQELSIDGVGPIADANDPEDPAPNDPGRLVRRIAGPSRFATAVQFSIDFGYATAADAPRVLLVEGQSDNAWAAGLPAGSQAGNGAAMVLATGDQLLPETVAFLQGGGVPLICGPMTSDTACDAAAAALAG